MASKVDRGNRWLPRAVLQLSASPFWEVLSIQSAKIRSLALQVLYLSTHSNGVTKLHFQLEAANDKFF